jgi:hypothetical protein
MAAILRELKSAFIMAKQTRKTTQQGLAKILEVDRSVVNRALAGRNLTLRTLGELIWALGYDYEFRIFPRRLGEEANWQAPPPQPQVETMSSAASEDAPLSGGVTNSATASEDLA